MTSLDLSILFLSLGLMLGVARVAGELFQRWNQPTVCGEILGGILLGPTVLGALWPGTYGAVFPIDGPVAVAREGLIRLAIVMFVFVAGMEVDLSRIWRQGRAAIAVSISGIAFPFSIGLIAGGLFPEWLGRRAGAGELAFALFFAVALSISALPVIARTLMDLRIYRSDLGMVVISAAIVDDLTGWLIFALVLSMLDGNRHVESSVLMTMALTLGFAVTMLTGVRWVVHKVLPWIQAHTTWPAGVLGLAMTVALVSAAATERIGIHAIFGAFLAGIAIGDSPHLREQTRATLNQLGSICFAPFFFASIGLKVNFVTHFDPLLTLVVILIATLGKVVGCGIGGRWGGLQPREAWGVGFAMNARGAMEIILGIIALQSGLIRETAFVALVIMSILTSMLSGPALSYFLRLRRPRRLLAFANARSFMNPLRASKREDVIRELVQVAPVPGWSVEQIAEAVLRREALMSTGIGQGIAVPHARIPRMEKPVIAVGLSPSGVDFDAPDGEPARLVFLILTPAEDNAVQVEVLADIARTFGSEVTRSRAIGVANFTEFLALLKTEQNEGPA